MTAKQALRIVDGWPRKWRERFIVHRSNESIVDAYIRTLAEKTVSEYGKLSGRAWKERIAGGLSHGKGPRDFPPKTLVRGIIVELEHTSDPLTAMEITMDHLVESLDYYKDLATIENPFADIESHKGRWRVVSADELRAHPDVVGEVFELIQTAYAPIGGHLKISSPHDMLAEIDYYDLVDLDDDPYADAALLGKRRKGVKQTASGHDGSKIARRELMTHKSNKLRQPGQYAEVSGRLADLILGGGVPVVTDEVSVEHVLGKPVRWVGEVPAYPGVSGWYDRQIGAHTERKIMVGMPIMNPTQLRAARLSRGG